MKEKIRKFGAWLMAAALAFAGAGAYGSTTVQVATQAELSAAIAAAAAGDTVTLVSDITLEAAAVQIGKKLTLDLATFKLTAAAGCNAIEVIAGGDLTIVADATNPGGIACDEGKCCIYADNQASNGKKTIVVNGGVYDGACQFNEWGSGHSGEKSTPLSVRINDGIFIGELTGYRCYYFDVYGGTFNKRCEIGTTTTCYAGYRGGKFAIEPGSNSPDDISNAESGKIRIIKAVYFKDGYYHVFNPDAPKEGEKTIVQDAVVKVGTTCYYVSLDDALAHANTNVNGDGELQDKRKLVLQKDVDVTGKEIRSEIKIDVNEKQITGTPVLPEGKDLVKNDDGTISVGVCVAQIGDKKYATVAAAVKEADTSDVVAIIKVGEYALPASLPKNIVVSGAVEGVVFNCQGSNSIASIPNAATFKNLTFNWGQTGYHGFQHPGAPIVFETCTLNGLLFLYDSTEFYGCTFINHKLAEMEAAGQSTDGVQPEYCLWLYTSKNTVFKNCTFDCEGKAVNVYNEGYEKVTTMSAVNCSFNSDKTFENYYQFHGFTSDPTKDVFKVNAALMTATTVIVDEGCTKTGSFAEKPIAGPGGASDNVSKASIAIGTDIVLDDAGKIVSGNFSQFEVGADVPAAETPLAATSIVTPGEGGKIIAKSVEEFAGAGTRADPYQIKNLEQLILFRRRINSGLAPYANNSVHYKLVADIDLASVENWEPIGTVAHPYSCWTFDGQGHKISNLTIKNAGGGNRAGFFGDVEAHPDLIGRYEKGYETVSSFKNIVFENVDIDVAGSYVGALIGWDFDYSTVSNVLIQGAISIKGVNQVGGFVGHGDPNLLDCSVTGDGTGIISGSQCVGGLVGVMPENGFMNKQRIARNTVTGVTVSGVKYVGGGVGRVDMYLHEILGNTVTQTILAAADESADLNTFGLVVGYDKAPDQGKINKILDNTAIEVDAPEGVDTIVGETVNNITIVGNGVVFDANGKVVSGTFEKLPNNVLAPGSLTQVDPVTGLITVIAPLNPDANGIYHIATPQDLKVFRLMVNGGNAFNDGKMYDTKPKTVVLDADIDLAGENWEPIGTSAYPFRGNFDGCNYTISNMKIEATTNHQGLFGYVAAFNGDTFPYPELKNLKLENVDISTTASFCGGLVGQAYCCNASNIVVKGNVISGHDQGSYVGGVFGHYYGTAYDCRFEGRVEGCGSVGGFAGAAGGAYVHDCVVIGDIAGKAWIGGIVGNGQEYTSCWGCTMKGTVSADVNQNNGTGGIAGLAGFYGTNEYMDNYFDGIVKVAGEPIGNPIIGAVNADSAAAAAIKVERNSWNTEKISPELTVAVVAKQDLPTYPTEEEVRAKAAKSVERNANFVGSAEDFKYVGGGVVEVAKGTEISEMSAEELKTAIAATAENPDIAEVIVNADGKVEVLMAVVKIVETGKLYASLEKAAAAAVAEQTIALTADIDLSGYARSAGHEIAFADNVTFDLAGFTVSMNNFGVEFLGNGLTVSNGTFKSVGEQPNYSVYFGDWNNEQAEYTGLTLVDLTCEGGVGVYKTKGVLFRDLQVTEAAAKNMYYAVNASGGSEVTIEGGSYESSVTDNSILLRAGTDADAYTIKSGSFRAVDRTDVALCMAGKATVYGGTFGMDPTAFLAEGYAAKPGTEPQTWTVVEKQSEVVVENVKVRDADGNVIENEAAAAQAAAITESVVAMAASAAVASFEGTDIKAITTTEDGRMVDALVEAFDKTGEEKAALAASTWNHEWLSNSLNRVLCDVSGDAASLKRLVYTVKPYATVNYTMGQLVKKLTVQIPNSVLVGKPITFRLGVIWDADDQVKVWRDGDYFGITTVKNDGDVKFVEIKSDNFSEFALEKVTDPTPTVCEVNGQAYESVAVAIAANTESPTAVIKLTAACGEQDLPLLWGQEIDVNGWTFTGSIVPTEEPESGFAAGQYEQVQTPAGRVFSAPKPVSVTTAGGTIKVRIPGKTAGDLEVVQTSGRPLWQDLVMGSDVKLIPQVPRSAIGTNTVTIRSNLDDAAVAAAAKVRDGVRVKYQLMKKVGGSGTYAQFGAARDTPVFTVEANELETQTFWKILTIFDEEY